jgi:hypothetical protein
MGEQGSDEETAQSPHSPADHCPLDEPSSGRIRHILNPRKAIREGIAQDYAAAESDQRSQASAGLAHLDGPNAVPRDESRSIRADGSWRFHEADGYALIPNDRPAAGLLPFRRDDQDSFEAELKLAALDLEVLEKAARPR